MGTWGAKTFENDAALDWLAGLEADGGDALRATLSAVAELSTEEWIDVDDGASAIAAAELVAAALGPDRDRLTPQAVRWLDAHPGAITHADVPLARRAVERVLGEESELAALWDEGDAEHWIVDVRLLLTRLEAAARVADTAPTAAPRATPRAKAGRKKTAAPRKKPEVSLLQSKQALMTFLAMRGLVATKAQAARIADSRDAAEVERWLGRALDAASVAAVLGE